MDIVKLNGVRKTYSLGKVSVEAVKGIDLAIEKGDFISIAGPSVGKDHHPEHDRLHRHADQGAWRSTAAARPLTDKALTSAARTWAHFQSFNLIPVLNICEHRVPPAARQER
jgi:putative ABC transport system ATP-binding protein